MTRLNRWLASLLCSALLFVGLWIAMPQLAQADELRNLADDKIAQAQGKVDLNNSSVRRFQQFPGMYPTLTVTQPEIALNEGFDRINDGQYR
ncbi:MAG: photosystem II complex extrinsic protein PsbU [Synechococcus sp. LacPavin_0920_WC12_MAG_50_7]|nr:photosystem II complex extrinsic protein PsbU [Synechococcus sp. LacPavin_0920_WC12_MAG_50_7]